jgi:hypothetical protein
VAYSEPQVDDVDASLMSALPELLPATRDDHHFDLAFVRYKPLRPLEHKLKAENLLWHSLRDAGLLEAWRAPLLAIQAQLGHGRAIWGVILDAGQTCWELRILNPTGGPALLDELRRTLAPWLRFAPEIDADAGDHHVLGFRFDAQTFARGSIDAIELHRRGEHPRELTVTTLAPGHAGPTRSYVVLETKREIDEVLARVLASRTVDLTERRRLLGRVLIPELFASRRLHILPGDELDALVFSGINVEQLLWFVRRFGFPAATVALLDSQREAFEQLLFDVQLRYRFDPQRDTIEYVTASYHGTL